MAEVEWIEDVEAFAALAPEWDALLLRSGSDDPFLSSEFLLGWWRHFGAGGAPRVAAVRAAGVLWGGLPLYTQRVRGERWLRFPGSAESALAGRTGLLAPEGSTGALEAITRGLAAREDWEVLELARVHGSPDQVDELVEVFERRGHRLRARRMHSRYLLDVPSDPEDGLGGASKNFRKKLARARRAAGEVGTLAFETRRGAEPLRAAWAAHVALSPDSDPRRTAFFEDLLPRLDARGWLQVRVLELDARTIAVGFDVSLQGVPTELLSSFDTARPELACDDLMTWERLAAAARQGQRSLELGVGEDAHKLRWATRSEPVASFVFERPPVRGRRA